MGVIHEALQYPQMWCFAVGRKLWSPKVEGASTGFYGNCDHSWRVRRTCLSFTPWQIRFSPLEGRLRWIPIGNRWNHQLFSNQSNYGLFSNIAETLWCFRPSFLKCMLCHCSVRCLVVRLLSVKALILENMVKRRRNISATVQQGTERNNDITNTLPKNA